MKAFLIDGAVVKICDVLVGLVVFMCMYVCMYMYVGSGVAHVLFV